MKYNKKYLFAACAALLLGMQSCDLEEYNPAGSTPDNVYKEQAGFEALVPAWGVIFRCSTFEENSSLTIS